jgi:hypothetical protein
MVTLLERISAAQDDWLANRPGDGSRPAVVIHVTQRPALERVFGRSAAAPAILVRSMPVYVCEHVWGPCVVDSRGLLALKMVGARQI